MKIRQAVRARAARWIDCGSRFFLAAALTGAQLPGGDAPFALGCVAASRTEDGAAIFSALLGTVLGAVLWMPFAAALPHLAAAILIAAAAVALQGLRLLRRRWVFPLCAGGLLLVVRGIYVLQSADPLSGIAPCLTAAVLATVSARWYEPLLQAERRPEPRALRFLAVALLSGFTEAELGGVSPARALIACVVLVSAWRQGTAEGAASGLLSGALMDLLSGDGTLIYTAALGTGGLAAGLCAGRGRLLSAAAGLCAGCMLLTSADTGAVEPALELAAGCVLLLLLPLRALGGKRLVPPGDAAPAFQGTAAAALRSRLSQVAATFHDLYESLGRPAPEKLEEDPAVIFDRTAEKICRDCALCPLCWKKEYVTTFNALNDATPFLLERGRVLAKDFPRHFADRCIHLPEFCAAVDGEVSAYLLRGRYRRQLAESRARERGQYAQLGELLSAAAAGLEATGAAHAMEYHLGAALRPKEGERVCGDSVGSFETEGLLWLVLSDGSGSGESARRESALTVRLLRQFLEAGIEPEAALKTMNTALSLRGEETGGFATIDLVRLRLSGGEATVYKYGAAPTYLKKGGRVSRITGSALPAGLRDAPAAPDVTEVTCGAGSFLVLVSDGVADALGDEWLQNFLAGWDGQDPQELAGLILQKAFVRSAGGDDCAVQVLHLPATGHRVQV